MKDAQGVARGTCLQCKGCMEFARKSEGNQCDDCGCSVTRHETIKGELPPPFAHLSVVDQALLGKGHNKFAFVAWWVFYSILAWASITAVITMYTMSGAHKTKAHMQFVNDTDSTIIHKICCMGYSLGMIFSFFSYIGSSNPERKSLSISLFGIKFIAFSSYVLQYNKLTPAVMMPTGVPWLTSRSMEWMFCTPCLMWVYRQVTCAYDPMHNSLFLDVAMVVTGWLGAVMKEPFCTWMDTTSCFVYLPVIDHLMDMFQRAIERKTECKMDKRSLKIAQNAVWAAWWGFTLIYYLQKDKFVDFATGEALYVCCDMIAKVVFTFVVLTATQEAA
ncbi:hypothetical protein SmJEL517_g04189 [Synchytrium microbalum]|uniref:Uncharacterized protein n=1 Tax=Synchytrium microbalum TaxID=1806994 RepID=A0A507C3K5_9FUNG|nr:uncharacterized protein SmJEL517_g04189 [Synchytrium microbalum]TPX32684.1 hypothetical protein SmJEL517_g04189 [Synchytrium microbalum]